MFVGACIIVITEE